MKLLIKGGHIIGADPDIKGTGDIVVDEGRVVETGQKLEADTVNVIDAGGMYVIPGLVDAHCHLREPGEEYKEDIESGTRSAAAGGFTTIACMPNTKPVIDNKPMVEYIINRAKSEGIINVYPIGAITKGQKGRELAEIGEMKFAGAVAVSDDGHPVLDSSLMKKAMVYASMFDITIISHCEDLSLSEEGDINEGITSTVHGLKGIPSAAEEVMVARELVLAEYTGTPVHIAHVSTALSVELIRAAKKRGVNVTAETCPHYFTLTEKACEGFNTLAKVNPPLRTQKDVEAVIEGLCDDTIDIIATDHAPHHKDEKETEFNLAANGIIGFETALPLAFTMLVKPGHMTLGKIVEKMCSKPSAILGLRKGTIETGSIADITIFDPSTENIVDVSSFKSKAKNSPFNGFRLSGKVKYTIAAGNVVIREGEVFA